MASCQVWLFSPLVTCHNRANGIYSWTEKSTPRSSIGKCHLSKIRFRPLYDNTEIQITDLLDLNNRFLFP